MHLPDFIDVVMQGRDLQLFLSQNRAASSSVQVK